MAEQWATAVFRDEVRQAADEIARGSVREGAIRLWSLGLATDDLGLAGALWQIWGRITDEYTHPDGDPEKGHRLAEEAASELQSALGDPDAERAFCDRWISQRLDIIL